ncbi:uncharacterized protein LOC123009932 [Tribolium madens]|uniref:uncharacterized protein LOC123009932 n=1 Tax=Tribolium madens TaxID=41895 RepID=UPI001CF721B4|nr:uncharacterized protein LOC123009932 [Tribolium madens]
MHISLIAIFVYFSLATTGALPFLPPQESEISLQDESQNMISGTTFRQVGLFGVIPVIVKLALRILFLPLVYSLINVIRFPFTIFQFFISFPFKLISFILTFPWSLGSLVLSIVYLPITTIQTIAMIISPVTSIVRFVAKVVSFLSGMPIIMSNTVYMYE